MGNCRTFPRDVVFTPNCFLGLGLKHLYVLQEISCLGDIISHTLRGSTTGQLYISTIELLLLELGHGFDLLCIPYDQMTHLATDSLIKSSWLFLHENSISLCHDIQYPIQREHDLILMQEFYKVHPTANHLLSLNKCRLFLHAYYVSDIATGSGSHLLDSAWKGSPSFHLSYRQHTWPIQGRPSYSDWEIWRQYLQRCKLKHHLGHWVIHNSICKWFYSPSLSSIFHHKDITWSLHQCIP